MEDLKEKALQVVHRCKMIRGGERIGVAVSGGQDSVSLLNFLLNIKDQYNLYLHVIHVNHLLRGNDSTKDDFFVKQLADQNKIPIWSVRADVGEYAKLKRMSIEEAARNCRYFCFVKAAKQLNLDSIAIAHTRDDNSETVLMRIIKGTGLKGLRAIQPVMDYRGVKIIRPFIDASVEDIRNYSRINRLKYRIDISNRYIKYFRNKIRHELMPVIEQDFNPKVRDSLSRLAETVSSDFEFLSSVTNKEYVGIVKREKDEMIVLDKNKLMKIHDAIKYRVVVKAVELIYPGSYLPYVHWMKILEGLAENRTMSIMVGRNISVDVKRGEIILQLRSKKKRYEYYVFNNEEIILKECDLVFSVKEVSMDKGENMHLKPGTFTELIDVDKLEFPLLVRNRRHGDRMLPLGSKHEKKIKDIMIDKKVPTYLRDEMPIVISKKKVVWCWGAGLSEAYKVTDDTKRIVKLSAISKD